MTSCLQRVLNISMLEGHPACRKSIKKEQKGQVGYLPTVSQPDPTEALDVEPPSSEAHSKTNSTDQKLIDSHDYMNKSYLLVKRCQ